METTNQDEAKDEVERLLIKPIQIGTMWVCRSTAPRAVVVNGFVHGKVRVSVIGSAENCPGYRIVDFHASFKLLRFE